MAIYTIKLKRGKAESWILQNPVLQPGEPGFEIDTGKLKIGNGVDQWIDLDYVGTTDIYATKEELQDAIENITIPGTEDMIPLSKEEILQICK